MKAAMASWLRKILPVAPAEQRAAVHAFLLFAAFMASYYVWKPARGSLYLHHLGAAYLPHVYLGSVAVAFVAMTIYNRAFIRLATLKLLSGTVWVLLACIAAFWASHLLSLLTPGVFAVAFFLWVSLYGTLVATLFWSLANDVFDLATGRAVYGFVGIGGILGAAAGSWLARLMVNHAGLKTEDLLPLGALLLCAAHPLIKRLHQSRLPAASHPQGAPATRPRGGLRLIFTQPYVAGIALLVTTMTLAATFLDVQYNQILGDELADKEAKTAFLGGLYTLNNVLAVGIQLLVTGPVHRRYGPLPGLYPLPLVGLVAVAMLILLPTLSTISITWALGLALMYSLNQASKELLYVPTTAEVKYGAKGYIDVFFFRLGDGGASLALILGKNVFRPLSLPLLSLSLITVVLWLALIPCLGRGYRRRVAALQ